MGACRKGRGIGTGERGRDWGAGCYEEEGGGVDGEGDVMENSEAGDEWDGCKMVHTRGSGRPGNIAAGIMGIHVVHIPSNGTK